MAPEIIFAFNVIFLATLGSTFVLDGQTCIADPPCICSGSSVFCDKRNLKTFPTFRESNYTNTNLYMYFQYNELTTIPNNAFSNIMVSNRTKIYVYLYDNHINNVEENAFRGIENAIVELQLQDNNLTEIPSSLKSLQNLGTLYLTDNPISSLSSSYDALYSLRHTLHTLYIDLEGFNPPWPVELNVLESLTDLYVTKLNASHLEYDTLQSFENKLTTLSIQYSQLEKIPALICCMKNLQTLQFSHNKNIHTNSTVYEPCKQNLTVITQIELTENNLRNMPDILQNVPSLTKLYIDHNNLANIDINRIPSNSSLSYLNLGFNNFTTIPSAIGKLTQLQYLVFYHNKITSIEEQDFNTLTKLEYLYISNNPIVYIAPDAFKFNLAVTNIYLRETNINTLPSSLAGLKHLNFLDLGYCPINCNCDLLFMKTLNFPQLVVYGNCGTKPTDIQTFLIRDLPQCP